MMASASAAALAALAVTVAAPAIGDSGGSKDDGDAAGPVCVRTHSVERGAKDEVEKTVIEKCDMKGDVMRAEGPPPKDVDGPVTVECHSELKGKLRKLRKADAPAPVGAGAVPAPAPEASDPDDDA